MPTHTCPNLTAPAAALSYANYMPEDVNTAMRVTVMAEVLEFSNSMCLWEQRQRFPVLLR